MRDTVRQLMRDTARRNLGSRLCAAERPVMPMSVYLSAASSSRSPIPVARRSSCWQASPTPCPTPCL